MWVWMGRFWVFARVPRAERRGGVHAGAKRGVRMGWMRSPRGSRVRQWAITVFVSRRLS